MRVSMGGRVVLAGMLAWGCAGDSGSATGGHGSMNASPGASPGASPDTDPPGPDSALPGFEVLQVTLADDSAGMACTANVAPGTSVMLTESRNEILIVTIESTCRLKDTLYIKYDDTNPKNKSKPDCLGQPKGTKLNGAFPVNAGQTVYLICTVAYDSSNTADEAFTVGWPSKTTGPTARKRPEASEIAMEDDPLK